MKFKKFSMIVLATITCVMIFCISAFAREGVWKWGDYGYWYDYGDGTYPRDGVYTIDGKKYSFDKHGWMESNKWIQGRRGWHYATSTGEFARNEWVGNYYIGDDYLMLTDTWTPDGYYVDSTGLWDPSKGNKNDSSANSGEYYTIDGSWDNRDQAGFDKDNRVDMWITVDPGDYYLGHADFGLYMKSGTPYSLYDDANPNGDTLQLGTADGKNWGARSTIHDTWYDLEYNGKDTIVLQWRPTAWTSSGKLIFKRRSGGKLMSSTGYGDGGVG